MPNEPECMRDLAVSWIKIGDLRKAQSDLKGAKEAYDALTSSSKASPPTPPGTPTGNVTSPSAGRGSVTCGAIKVTSRALPRPIGMAWIFRSNS